MPVTGFFSTISSSSQSKVPPASGVEGRKHAGRHPVQHGDFDRAGLQHLGAQRRHLQHFLVGDLLQPPRLGHDARVGGVDAVDVGVDVAAVGLDAGRHRHRAGVGTAAAEGGDAVVAARRPGSPPPPRPRRLRQARRSSRPAATPSMRAEPCIAEVLIGICQPSQERACTPDGVQRDGQKARRSPARPPPPRRRIRAGREWRRVGARRLGGSLVQATSLLVSPAMAETTTATWLPRSTSRFTRVGDMADAVQIGHRGAAEFHRDLGHRLVRLRPMRAGHT